MGVDGVIEWLLDSDPALRWQVERDLCGAPRQVWEATRARVATEGFGARMLALQDPDGQWAGGAYFPAGFDFDTVESEGQPWTATTWSLNALREWGVEAPVLRERRTVELLAANSRWEYEDLPFWGGEVDCCINAWTLANGVWLGADVAGIAEWFVEHQLADGGWNCMWVEGATRSSFHSTLNALRGLFAFEAAGLGTPETQSARTAGEEYLLERNLFRRLSTGDAVGPWVDNLTYPFRWRYSVLNALDYFGTAPRQPDPRMSEAVEMIRAARRPDGTWLQGRTYPGRVWFDVDVATGAPSKWLTFHASRVLMWWDGHAVR